MKYFIVTYLDNTQQPTEMLVMGDTGFVAGQWFEKHMSTMCKVVLKIKEITGPTDSGSADA